MFSNEEVGLRIKKLREINRWNKEELAAKVGITTKFLYEVEAGKKGLSAQNLVKFSKVLKVSSDFLLFGKKGNVTRRDKTVEIIEAFPKEDRKSLQDIMQAILDIYKRKEP